MSFTIEHIRQVKVPVTDLQRSVTWYRRLLGLQLIHEFVENGEIAGAVLLHPAAGFVIGLRLRSRIESRPLTRGFDLFSLGVPTRDDLVALQEFCHQLGVTCGEIVDRSPFDYALDVEDPDGTVIRFLTPRPPDAPDFAGLVFTDGGPPQSYDSPRLV